MASGKEPVSGLGLLLALERRAGRTLHEQLECGLRDAVRSGQLPPGTRLPSSRVLATELRISRGVVLEAYAQLTAEGYLTASQGAPTRVAAGASAERPPLPAGSLERRHDLDLQPGLPDLAGFPRDAWVRSVRAALREAPFDALGPADPRGSAVLRNELMGYLGRVRGAAPEPEHTIIGTGFTQAFAMLCRSLQGRGVEQIAVEDPGWASHRLIAERAGLEPVAVPVDVAGVDVEALERTGCEVVVLTPAHQFPTGAVLAPERRAALLEWAEERDALIVEDDYDSELRYDRLAVGALQGLAPERVCHIGSLSKRLVPGLRIGWILSPSWLTGELTYEKGVGDGAGPVLEELAAADFIARGELDRHLRRMRLRYRDRRAALATALAPLPVEGIEAGLHLLVRLPGGADEERVCSEASRRGVAVEGLSPDALVVGFANAPEPSLVRAGRLLREAVDASMS